MSESAISNQERAIRSLFLSFIEADIVQKKDALLIHVEDLVFGVATVAVLRRNIIVDKKTPFDDVASENEFCGFIFRERDRERGKGIYAFLLGMDFHMSIVRLISIISIIMAFARADEVDVFEKLDDLCKVIEI